MAARMAISTDSRSSLPVLRCAPKISRSRQLTARSTSWRIVSAVFFLCRERVFHRLCAADSLVDFQQFTAQFPKTVKGFDLVLRLAQFGGGGEGFTYRFPIHFACQPEVGPWPSWFGCSLFQCKMSL